MRISDWSSDVCSSDLIGHMCAHLAAVPLARVVTDVDALGRGILADDQQLLRPRRDELFGLAQHRVDAAADAFSAQLGDDDEGAAVVAAVGHLEVAEMRSEERRGGKECVKK